MSTSRISEGLTGLANGIEKSLNAYGHVTLSNDDWKDVVSALRLAATPKAGVDREVLKERLRTKRDEFMSRGITDMTEDEITSEFADAILALLPSVLGGVDQPRSNTVRAGMREALLEIANRSANFMDDDAADWMPSIYRIACEAVGEDPGPLLQAALQLPEAGIQSEPVIHRMDEIDAARIGHDWLNTIAASLPKHPSNHITQATVGKSEGGMFVLWHKDRVQAAIVTVRDDANFTQLLRFRPSEANSPAAPVALIDGLIQDAIDALHPDVADDTVEAFERDLLRKKFAARLPAPVDAGVREALRSALRDTWEGSDPDDTSIDTILRELGGHGVALIQLPLTKRALDAFQAAFQNQLRARKHANKTDTPMISAEEAGLKAMLHALSSQPVVRVDQKETPLTMPESKQNI